MKRKLKAVVAMGVGLLWMVGVFFGYENLHVDEQETATQTITIGYQKGDIFNLAKIKGTLEEELNEKGYKVKWKLFTDGSALLEVLMSGSIDYGRTGNTPPVVSQGSDSDIAYVASSYSKAEGSAILIPEASTISSLAELKGKKIAVSKGSSAHYFLIKALASVGLTTDDVELVFLDPSESRIAFESGNVDAWAIWDPYTAAAETELNAQELTNATGFSTDRDFILSSKSFLADNEEVTDILVAQMASTLEWVNNNKSTIAIELADSLGISEEVAQTMVNRREYGMDASLTDEIMKEQQDIADTFYENGFITEQIDVTDALYDEK